MLLSKAQQDANLATRLAVEDTAESAGRLPVDSRLTCGVHRRWIHDCVSSPVHVNQVTGHRWCRTCQEPVTVAVDQLTRTVTMQCPKCGDGRSPATNRLTTSCQSSLSAEVDRPQDFRQPRILRAA